MDYTFDVIPGTAVYPLVMEHMPQIVERVRAAYEEHHRQQTMIPNSPFLRFPHHPRARIISAPAYLGEPFNVAGLKWVASFPDNIQHNVPRASAVLVLNDPETSYPYAVLEGASISAARTAASAVLAAQALRYHDRRVTRLGFLGTGLIARYMYTFFYGMDWDIAQVVCADAQRTYAEQFTAMVRATGQPNVTVYDRAEDVLRVCDLTVIATTAATPHIYTADVLAYNPLLPWFTRIASNTFNVLLWRPAYVYRKYGHLLITESWVAPHFTALLASLHWVELNHKDIGVYFEAHLTIDSHHGTELVDGFTHQVPPLTQYEIDEVLLGAHLAIAAYGIQCDYVLPYLVQMA